MKSKANDLDPTDLDGQELDEAGNNSGSISFTDLEPKEILTFDLPDGRSIPFKTPESMSGEDHSKMVALENRMDKNFEAMKKNYQDKQAVANYERYTSIFVQLILPDIPEDFLASLKAGQKMKLITLWRQRTGSDTKKE